MTVNQSDAIANEGQGIRDLVNPDRIAQIVWDDTIGDKRYVIWQEAGVEGPDLAVHVLDDRGLLRSGEYRLTQIEALQLVVDLMGGTTL